MTKSLRHHGVPTADRIHLLPAMDLLNLPTEIILLVTEFLPPENLLQLALTCRRFSSLILPRARVATLVGAVDRDDLDRFVQVLMTNNVAINYPLDGFTILEYVISFGAKHCLEPLFHHGVSFRPRPGSACHSNQYSLLHLAAIQDEPESEDVLRIILDHHGDEADLLATDDLGFTPLMAAVKTGSIGADVLLDAYLERGIDIDPPDSDHPLLLEAVLYGNHNWELIFRLLDLDVEMNPRDATYGFTPLHWFCHGGILLDEDEFDEDYESDAIWGDDSLDVLIFNSMIKKGADLNAQAVDGLLTPLHCAARTGMSHIIPAFSTHNANFRARCTKGGTALHWAATGGDIMVIDELVKVGMSVFDKDDDNRIPLLWAHPMGRYELDRDLASEVIKHLIVTHGSPFDHIDNKRQNILHIAAAHRQDLAVAFLLVTKHMDPNLQDIDGMTPLHLAAREHDSSDTVSLILRVQPDVMIQNKLGQTALDLAISEGDQDVVKLFQGYMKNGREATYSKSDIRRYFLPAKL